MSDDLIRRSAVIDLIRPRLNSSKEGTLEHQRLYALLKSVEELPIAYDADKVVEQIEMDEKHTFDGCINKRYAIKIVKAGGVNE